MPLPMRRTGWSVAGRPASRVSSMSWVANPMFGRTVHAALASQHGIVHPVTWSMPVGRLVIPQ